MIAAADKVPARPSVLIVSNGHGEDAVGMALARELAPHGQIAAFPLVGNGAAYAGISMLEPRRPLPSGGFGLRGSWRALWADVRSGAVSHWIAQRATLRGQRGRHDLVIAIGDVYCLRMAALAGARLVFIATAKSEYNERHRWLERLLIRRFARTVFTRDQVTADALKRAGLPAIYAGNPLMDTIGSTDPTALVGGSKPTVTILPGSRADVYGNLQPLLRLCETVGGRMAANFLCAFAPGVDLDRVKAGARGMGWQATEQALWRDGVTVQLTRAFGEAIRAAAVVVGLAGTANEQAAGLGKPVVTFAGPGAQVTPQFVKLQQRLLGEALVPTRDWDEAAEVVVRLLRDPSERAARGAAGRQRMGEAGAVRKISQAIVDLLKHPD